MSLGVGGDQPGCPSTGTPRLHCAFATAGPSSALNAPPASTLPGARPLANRLSWETEAATVRRNKYPYFNPQRPNIGRLLSDRSFSRRTHNRHSKGQDKGLPTRSYIVPIPNATRVARIRRQAQARRVEQRGKEATKSSLPWTEEELLQNGSPPEKSKMAGVYLGPAPSPPPSPSCLDSLPLWELHSRT